MGTWAPQPDITFGGEKVKLGVSLILSKCLVLTAYAEYTRCQPPKVNREILLREQLPVGILQNIARNKFFLFVISLVSHEDHMLLSILCNISFLLHKATTFLHFHSAQYNSVTTSSLNHVYNFHFLLSLSSLGSLVSWIYLVPSLNKLETFEDAL